MTHPKLKMLGIYCLLVSSALAGGGHEYPYIITDSRGVYYARCSPSINGGTTKIFRVRDAKDELIEEHSWFEKNTRPNQLSLVAVGWDHEKKKPQIAIFRAHRKRNPEGHAKQIEFSIYLDGKLVRSYTTSDLKELGAKVSTDSGKGRQPKGDYADFVLNGYDGYMREKAKYGCYSLSIGGKTVLVDIATGKVLKSFMSSSSKETEGSNKHAEPDGSQ